jgi:phenylacetate-CoA ligase
MSHIDLDNPIYMAWRAYLEMTEYHNPETLARAGAIAALTWAYENAPGYRTLYDEAGVSPFNLVDLEDLWRFPTVDKAMLRADIEAFSVPMPERVWTTTGGSTGEPFGFWRDPLTFGRELASKAHQYRAIGWSENDRQLTLRGLPVNTLDYVEVVPEFHEMRCSSYHLTPKWMHGYYEAALDYRPDWIRCYPSSGYAFAQWLHETGRKLPVKGVLCASENLYDFQKARMQEVFGGRIFDHYGHYECAVLAGYCEGADTYHVLPQYGYAELLDEDGRWVTEKGQIGEIVVTSFIMHATPMVRYRTGDLAEFGGWGCPVCGRACQVWRRIVGREQEYLEAADGRRVYMTAVNFHDDTLSGVQAVQFWQMQPGMVTVYYAGAADEQRMRAGLERKLAGFDLELEQVESIKRTRRGKQQLVVRNA